MSVYAINKLLFHLRNDQDFGRRIREDQARALGEFDLTDDERIALESGDIRALYDMGVHVYLLGGLSHAGRFGVTRENYIRRIKLEEPSPREGRPA